MTVRAKFVVQNVTRHIGGHETVKATAVGDDGIPENQRYHKYTPTGDFSITVNNPEIVGFFKPGDKFYMDITKADK